jgi:hypothetical protein
MPAKLTGLFVENMELDYSGDFVDLDLVGDSQPDVRVWFFDGDGLLVVNEVEDKSLLVEVLDGAPMNADISFNAHIRYEQSIP